MVAVAEVEKRAWRVVEPRTKRLPVLVAPPKMVRPVAAPPAPMVEEAVEFSPPKKCMREVVDWSEPNLVNGKEKVMEARKSVPAVAATREPPLPVPTFTSEPLAMEEIARLVVVA